MRYSFGADRIFICRRLSFQAQISVAKQEHEDLSLYKQTRLLLDNQLMPVYLNNFTPKGDFNAKNCLFYLLWN